LEFNSLLVLVTNFLYLKRLTSLSQERESKLKSFRLKHT